MLFFYNVSVSYANVFLPVYAWIILVKIKPFQHDDSLKRL